MTCEIKLKRKHYDEGFQAMTEAYFLRISQ
jgi:hypothetical protein